MRRRAAKPFAGGSGWRVKRCNANALGRVLPAAQTLPEKTMFILILVLLTVVAVGLAAIALAEPRRSPYVGVWNDETERRLLREGIVRGDWW
jgi:hypothetical protein